MTNMINRELDAAAIVVADQGHVMTNYRSTDRFNLAYEANCENCGAVLVVDCRLYLGPNHYGVAVDMPCGNGSWAASDMPDSAYEVMAEAEGII